MNYLYSFCFVTGLEESYNMVILTDGVLDSDHGGTFFMWYNFINK